MPVVQKLCGLLLFASLSAHAGVQGFTCTGNPKSNDGKILSATLTALPGGALGIRVSVEAESGAITTSEYKSTWRAEADPAAANTYRVKSLDGSPIGTLWVLDPDRGTALLQHSSGTYACRISSTADAAAEQAYREAVAAWDKFKARQPKACASWADSQETIRDQRPKATVILFQGYAVSPGQMRALRDLLAGEGVNVLVPRLRGHFNVNPRDLDEVKAEQWIQQSEEVLKIAAKMSPKVIVAGYSLGGLLAARLALLHPDKVTALLAFSPAWRVTGLVKAGTAIGSIFGLSANDLLGSDVRSCGTYISARGGREVERLISATEEAAGGSDFGAGNSAFRRFRVPSFVVNILDDDTVDGAFVNEVRGNGNSSRTATATILKGNHMFWLYGVAGVKTDYSPFRGDLSGQVQKFLKANKLLE